MIKIARSTETFASCGVCGRANYDSDFGTKKEVDELFDLSYGRDGGNTCTIAKLCRRCAGNMGDKILSFFTFGEGRTK